MIGAGPAGTCGANTAALAAHRHVALIEREREIGGAGLNSGTVPSKTLRETALALSGWRSRRLFGVDLSLRREATIGDFMHHSDAVTLAERGRVSANLRHGHVQQYEGSASFVDAHTVKVTKRDGSTLELKGDTILIATGSSPAHPSEFPFEHSRVHDSDELLHLDAMPKRLVVVGAGVIGAEYACTFAAMGVSVDVVDGRDVLLSFLDLEITRALMASMKQDGIRFHLNERVTSCDVSNPSVARLTLSSGARLEADDVLVCAGRVSNTATLNLEAAGIAPGHHGLVPVNDMYQTIVPNIYAAGDVIGPPALAATSMEQARVAMCHAFSIEGKDPIAPLLPTGIYTIPEVSFVGETEEALKKRGAEYIVGRGHYRDTARGRIVGDETGFLKLLFAKDDMKLLGVHVIGEIATEVVHVGLIAMLAGATADIFNRACFNYPTLDDLYKTATYDAILRKRGLVK